MLRFYWMSDFIYDLLKICFNQSCSFLFFLVFSGFLPETRNSKFNVRFKEFKSQIIGQAFSCPDETKNEKEKIREKKLQKKGKQLERSTERKEKMIKHLRNQEYNNFKRNSGNIFFYYFDFRLFDFSILLKAGHDELIHESIHLNNH